MLASLLAVPAVASDGATRTSEQASEQCLNVAIDQLASKLGLVVNVFGVISLGVTSPEPGDGLSVVVYIVPGLCSAGATALMPSPGQLPPLEISYDLTP